MAAYAALVSLRHIIEQIQCYHFRRQFFQLKQLRQLESLHKKVCHLQDLLESHSVEARGLDIQIADASYAAEDIIETYIVDEIHAHRKKPRIVRKLPQELQKCIECMDSIKKDAAKIIKTSARIDKQQPRDLPPAPGLSQKDTVVGFGEDLNRVMGKVLGEMCSLQVIPVTGMGGIGKTTLAKKVYEDPSMVECFDVRAWVTVSQDYSVDGMLLGLLKEVRVFVGERGQQEYHQMGEKLYRHLFERRYLIVFDDMWSIEAWNKLKLFLPDNNNRSRVMVTTRLSNVAKSLGFFEDLYEMNLLDEKRSWDLFCRKVFGEESCPHELEDIGKEISKNCRGLPLSIVVIGGLLTKSKMTREYWTSVAEDVNMFINSEDDERCLKILSLSYEHLPVHLKPCFLYLGVFPEDHEIRVPELIKLWVAEGFLKANKSKSLEEVAEDYLKDLVDRNLVYSSKLGCIGNMKICKIHDLLRDLCLREAEKERFLFVTKVHNSNICNNKLRRIAIHRTMSNYKDPIQESCDALQTISGARSLICYFEVYLYSPPSLDCRLLRVLDVNDEYSPEDIFPLVNLRYLRVIFPSSIDAIPSSICLFWNLETLIGDTCMGIVAPREIWEMPQLRHLMIYNVSLPDPPPTGRMDERDEFVMENLQTLSYVQYFRCTEEVLMKIPNIKKLKLLFFDERDKEFSHYFLSNLGRLRKLESLTCKFLWGGDWPSETDLLRNIEFSLSLKKVTLRCASVNWEELATKIGTLPHLEKLNLEWFKGDKWNPVEGQFLRLKFLRICNSDLVHWTADSVHFPRLEHLVLVEMKSLKEIPSGIGDIGTLQSIQLCDCKDSVVVSATKILEEQQLYANEDIHLEVIGSNNDGEEEDRSTAEEEDKSTTEEEEDKSTTEGEESTEEEEEAK